MKKTVLLILIIVTVLLTGCTDATRANLKAFGQTHHVRMFNGGILVAEWTSTGKVATIRESDGWQFRCANSHQLVRVSGDVIIEVIK